MLDVHPPHQAAHTWRDFFIHIATIVIGLIIAVGLEQSVEAIHHHHQVIETREALRHERIENYARLARYVNLFREESAHQQAAMALLISLQHPTSKPAPTAFLHWSMARNQFETSAWHTAQGSGVLTLMPPDEVLADERVYSALQDVCDQNEKEWLTLNDTRGFTFTNPNISTLSPTQLAAEITLMQQLMIKHYLRGNFMSYPHELDPNFVPGPSNAEQASFHHFLVPIHDNPATP